MLMLNAIRYPTLRVGTSPSLVRERSSGSASIPKVSAVGDGDSRPEARKGLASSGTLELPELPSPAAWLKNGKLLLRGDESFGIVGVGVGRDGE